MHTAPKSANFKKGVRVSVYAEEHIRQRRADYCKSSIDRLVN